MHGSCKTLLAIFTNGKAQVLHQDNASYAQEKDCSQGLLEHGHVLRLNHPQFMATAVLLFKTSCVGCKDVAIRGPNLKNKSQQAAQRQSL